MFGRALLETIFYFRVHQTLKAQLPMPLILVPYNCRQKQPLTGAKTIGYVLGNKADPEFPNQALFD